MSDGAGYLDLLEKALPSGVELRKLAGLENMEGETASQIAERLAEADWINWEAYLLLNPDVSAAGIDPRLHFTRFGIYEGRRLSVFEYELGTDCPDVSIIIPNFNNSLYLDKCLCSALDQTLSNIEVIVIDDGSTDGSREIIKAYETNDERIVAFFHGKNLSQHLGRRNGVMLARGKYVMFLDSDDYLAPCACEVLCHSMLEDADIVSFNFNSLNQGRFTPAELGAFNAWHTNPCRAVFSGIQILHAAFGAKKLSPLVWNKMYRTSLARRAFREMANASLPRGQDIYESFVLLSLARKVVHIPDRLYTYRLADGISSPDKSKWKVDNFEKTGDVILHLKSYCQTHNHLQYYRHIAEDFLGRSLDVWLRFVPVERSRAFLEKICSQYGNMETLQYLAYKYFEQWIPVANAFANMAPKSGAGQMEPRRIGIFYPRLAIGGVETIIRHLTWILGEAGFEVIVISEERTADDISLHPGAKIRYVHSSEYTRANIYPHLSGWLQVLAEEKIDLMLYQYAGSRMFLWELVACKLLDIPVLLMHHHDFANKFIYCNERYDILTQLAIFRAVDKVLVLSTFAETYYRLFGVDAVYLPNPVPMLPVKGAAGRPRNIFVMCRFGDAIKQANDSLEILARVVEKLPDVKMYFVGDFGSEAAKRKFYDRAHELGVDGNVVFTGWLQEPERVFDQCAVFLSTSYWESFGMSMAEAQSSGMPCVIYDVLVTQPLDNPSIITVPQRDTDKAATELINLLSDGERLEKLGKMAVSAVEKFNFENYAHRILDLLHDYHRFSLLSALDAEGYERIITIISGYTINPVP